MLKKTKLWLLMAGLLVALGGIVFTVTMTAAGWDFTRLGTVEYEENTHAVSEEFSGIAVQTRTADILLVPSDDGSCRVVCKEEKKVKHSVTVKDGILTVSRVDERAWYDYIGIDAGDPEITLYLPQAEYAALVIEGGTGDVEIPRDFSFASIDVSVDTGDVTCLASASGVIELSADTGDILLEGVTAKGIGLRTSTGGISVLDVSCEGNTQVSVTTGKVVLQDVACKNLSSKGGTGCIELKSVIVAEGLSIERSTGDVTFAGCDAFEILVTTDTGDVTGTLLTEKVFRAFTDTGDVDVPEVTMGYGTCEIRTDTGDIEMKIQK